MRWYADRTGQIRADFKRSHPGGERRRQSLGHPNSVKVSVSDTGPGIAAEFHLEVFDDFFRLPQTEKLSDGMGLGLSIARSIVESHGGRIWADNNPGGGATFRFTLTTG